MSSNSRSGKALSPMTQTERMQIEYIFWGRVNFDCTPLSK
jgi:hypothetical protein